MTVTLPSQKHLQSFVIEGGQPLGGTVKVSGNKNGVLPVLAACVLTSEPVRLTNVPRIRDVATMLALLDDIGAEVEWTGANEVRVDASTASAWRRSDSPFVNLVSVSHAFARVSSIGRLQ